MSSLNIMRLLRILLLISLLIPLVSHATQSDDAAFITSASDVIQKFFKEFNDGGGTKDQGCSMPGLDKFFVKPDPKSSYVACAQPDTVYYNRFLTTFPEGDDLKIIKTAFLNQDKTKLMILTQVGGCLNKPQRSVFYNSFKMVKVDHQWKIDTIYPVYWYDYDYDVEYNDHRAHVFKDGAMVDVSPKKYGCEWKEGTFEKDLFKTAKE